MKFLILHSNSELLAYLRELLEDMRWRHEWSSFEVVAVDGEHLTYRQAIDLLKQDFDCIILNLRLPNLLSVRITELVRQLKLDTRVFLWTGAPMVLGEEVKLFDGVVFLPDELDLFEERLVQVLSEKKPAARAALPNQEQMDAAILNLFKHYRWFTHEGGPYTAFCDYRDCYPSDVPGALLLNAMRLSYREWQALAQGGLRELETDRLARRTQVAPLRVRDRLAKVQATLCGKLPQGDQRIPVTKRQFLRLGLGLGLALTRYRATVGSILGDFERAEMIVRPQQSAALFIPRGLGQSLLNQSDQIPQAHRSIKVLTTEVLKLV